MRPSSAASGSGPTGPTARVAGPLSLLACLAAAALAEPASVEVRASTAAAVLGQPVRLRAAARLPSGASLTLDLERSATEAFAVTRVEEDPAAREFQIEVIPLAVGRVEVPLFWTLTLSESSTSLASPPVALAVSEPPLDPGERLRDIKAPREARRAWGAWLMALLLLAAAAALLRRLRRQRPGPEAALPAADARPPEEIAEEELRALEASGLWERALFGEFYFRLTEILRRYLERRYGMPATGLTTSELHRQLRQAELDRPALQSYRELFDRADLVKFAKASPDPDWGAADIQAGRRLVALTTPRDLAGQGASP